MERIAITIPMWWMVVTLLGVGALLQGTANAQLTETTQSKTPLVDAFVTTNAASISHLSAAQSEQAELVQQLLRRLEELEKAKAQETERARLVEKAHQAEVQNLQGRITELEGKVGSLQSGRTISEVAVSTEDGPTIQELDQKLRVMEHDNQLDAEAAEARAKKAPRLSVGADGFVMSSAETNFVLKVRGLLQIDSHRFFDDNSYLDGNDGFLVRRAWLILAGTVYRDFDFQLAPNFAGSSPQLIDAWLNYRYCPELQLRIGKMKGPVGLENLQSDTVGSFNERSMASALVPVRNIGLQLGGEIGGGTLSYAAGLFNGDGDARVSGNSDFSDNEEFAGRIFLQPFKQSRIESLQGLGMGVAGSFADINFNANALPTTTGGTLPGYVTSELQQFFAYNPTNGVVQADGTHWRFSPQGYYYYGPFGLLGEYVISDQGVYNTATAQRANLHQTAWQVCAQWVLTGEPASFTGIVPKRPFDPRAGNWGAWQIVGRVSQLKIDEDAFSAFANPVTSGNEAFTLAAGLNWWLNRNIRVLSNFSYTTFEGGGMVNPAIPGTLVPPATVTAQDEKAFFTRVQLFF